jgi:hypothetical protein
MTGSILQPLQGGGWVSLAAIADESGVSIRSAAQQLRHHVTSGLVERSEGPPYSFRLLAGGGGRSRSSRSRRAR